MIRSRWLTRTWLLATGLLLAGCATSADPWSEHAATAGLKATSMDPAAVCPVVVRNGTEATLDASYEVVGMRFDLGLLPSGQTAEFNVQCQAGRVRATAVSHAMGLDEPEQRFQKMVRLDLARVTQLRLTQADAVR